MWHKAKRAFESGASTSSAIPACAAGISEVPVFQGDLAEALGDVPVLVPEIQHPPQRCYDSVKGLLISEVRDSWFYGYRNPGGDRGRFLMFTEGVPAYRRIFKEIEASGYQGFEIR